MENQNKQHPKSSGREPISPSPAIQSSEYDQSTDVPTPHELTVVDSSPTQTESSSRGHITPSPVHSNPTIIPGSQSPAHSKSCSSEHISLSPTIKSPDESPDRSSVSSDNISLTHGSSPGKEKAPEYPLKKPPPASVKAVLNRDVREEPMEAITKTDKNRNVAETEKTYGHGGSGNETGRRRVIPSLSILRRNKREKMVKKAALGLRVFGFLFSLVSFSVMVADRHQGWALDSFERYREFRYCMSVNVIGFVYSGVQALDLSHNLATGKYIGQHQPGLRRYFDFTVDQARGGAHIVGLFYSCGVRMHCECNVLAQLPSTDDNIASKIIAYLLISASSSAATRIDDWQSNWGTDKFTSMAIASISMSFLAFVALASSSLISGYALFTSKSM